GTLECDHHKYYTSVEHEFLTGKCDAESICKTFTPEWGEEIATIKRKGEAPETCALRCFIGAINGDPIAKKYMIDVYAALDMSIPGILAYRSILNGNAPISMPDFRDKAQREQYRNDRACTDLKVAGAQLLPSNSFYEVDTPQEVYDKVHRKFLNKDTD
ncbi:MAG: hypothetical protein ACI4SH_03225, partial [Candidatus Scatosoma sp.]